MISDANPAARSPRLLLSVVLAAGLLAWSAPHTLADEVAVDTLLQDLQRPCSLAVRLGGTADRYELFIAESGAGRVLNWSNRTPHEARPAVTGFSRDSTGELSARSGPTALLFLDPDLLLVASTADRRHGATHAFELADGGPALTVDQAIDRLTGPIGDSLTRSRANRFVTDMILSTGRGRPGKDARLYTSRVQAGVVGPPDAFWGESHSGRALPPLAVATSPAGHFVAVLADRSGSGPRCRLVFFNPIDGGIELEMPLELSQVVSLAFSPTTGSLYAAEHAHEQHDRGGIYRIDDLSQPGQPACQAVRIAGLRRPTDLAFAPDGALYISTYGDDSRTGRLMVLTGHL